MLWSLWPAKLIGSSASAGTASTHAKSSRAATNVPTALRVPHSNKNSASFTTAPVASLVLQGATPPPSSTTPCSPCHPIPATPRGATSSSVLAAIIQPDGPITIHMQADKTDNKPSSVHALRMLSVEDSGRILSDAKRIGTSIGWSDRGVSLPTQDLLVQNLSAESVSIVHRSIREQLLPFVKSQYPHLRRALEKQPYPRPGNLFIVHYSASSARAGGRGLNLHRDETALTFNLCLSPDGGFGGGGTYFCAASSHVDGFVVRPNQGVCLVHSGDLKHAGVDITSGDRYILVGFYNADGRDREGEDKFFKEKTVSVLPLEHRKMRTTLNFSSAITSGAPSLPPTDEAEHGDALEQESDEECSLLLSIQRCEGGRSGWPAPLLARLGLSTPDRAIQLHKKK